MGTKAESGALSLENGVIRFEAPSKGGGESYTLDVGEVLLIGELTNDSGPFLDDWFLLFFTSPDNYATASCYAEGCIEFLDALGKQLGYPLLGALAGSADWASNAMWPPEVDGKPVFTFTDLHATTVLGRVWEAITGGPRSNRQELTPEIAAYLKRAAGAR